MGSNKADAMRHESLARRYTTSMEIVALTRQVKSVTSAVNGILYRYGDQLGILCEDERKTLNAAVLVMKGLLEDIGRAKDAVKRIEAERNAEDKRRELAALEAAKALFAQPGMGESIALVLHMGDAFHVVCDLRRSLAKRDAWSVAHYAQEVEKEAVRELSHRVKKEIERGRSAMEAATELHQAFMAAKPALLELHGAFIQEVNDFLAQSQIEKSNT